MIRGVRYAVKQAFKQVFRNHTMTFASIFSITAMLLILGLFFIIVVNINLAAESAKSQFDTISIYIDDDAEQAAVDDMIKTLQRRSDIVSDVEYVSKEVALEEMKQRWGEMGYLLESRPTNPLPSSLRVKVHNIEDSTIVAEMGDAFEASYKVTFYETEVEKLLKITDFIQMGALVIIGFLIIVSVVVVSNTVKLTVLAREREISIMKYVGATNWFIRGPFLTEGILIGCISAAVSVGLVSLIYTKVSELMVTALAVLFTALVPMDFLLWNLVTIFLALGVSIGAFGSILSMRRFLDT